MLLPIPLPSSTYTHTHTQKSPYAAVIENKDVSSCVGIKSMHMERCLFFKQPSVALRSSETRMSLSFVTSGAAAARWKRAPCQFCHCAWSGWVILCVTPHIIICSKGLTMKVSQEKVLARYFQFLLFTPSHISK